MNSRGSWDWVSALTSSSLHLTASFSCSRGANGAVSQECVHGALPVQYVPHLVSFCGPAPTKPGASTACDAEYLSTYLCTLNFKKLSYCGPQYLWVAHLWVHQQQIGNIFKSKSLHMLCDACIQAVVPTMVAFVLRQSLI
jgi:hypothetical protein